MTTNIDEQIRHALSESERRELEQFAGEVGVFEMIGMAFKGRQAWLTYYIWFAGVVAFAAGLYFLQQFFNTADLKSALGWMMAMHLCLTLIVVVKIIGWQHMHRQELLLELKRLEMKVMLLARETDQ
jgi:hypothetical protein